jgi:hypothetical protein
MPRDRERPDATVSSAGRDRVPAIRCSGSPRRGLLKNENTPFDCTAVFAAREDARPPIQGHCDNLNLAPDEQPPGAIEIRLRQLRQETDVLQQQRVDHSRCENCLNISTDIRTPQSDDCPGAKASVA